MNMEFKMKENYELKGPPRKNPYAEKIKNHGFSVSIHYDEIEDDEDFRINMVMELLKDPGLNSLHLYKKNGNEASPPPVRYTAETGAEFS